MKNNSKRICALLLAIVMCVTCVVPVFAETDVHTHDEAACPGEGNRHVYNDDEKNCTIDPSATEVYAPACGELGFTKYKCAECGDYFLDGWTPALTGCDEEVTPTAASCSKDGKLTDGYLTVVCKTHDNKTTVITTADDAAKWEAYGYNRADYVAAHKYEKKADAESCLTGGKTWEECSVCGHKINEKDVVATGHAYKNVGFINEAGEPSAPTCIADGVAKYVCDNCGDVKYVVVKSTSVNAKHTYDEKDVVVVTPADCTNPGVGKVTCTACDTEVSVELPSLGHDFTVEVKEQASTCTAVGYTAHKTCSRCGIANDEKKEIPAGHKWDSGVTSEIKYIVDGVEYDCEKYFETVFTCTLCGETNKSSTEPVGHDWKDDPYVIPATCTSFGFEIYACTVCGLIGDPSNPESAGVVRLPKAPHNITKVTVDSDCDTPGSETETCSDCSYTKTTVIPEKGHNYQRFDVPATCHTPGYSYDECTVCFDIRKGDDTDENGHYAVDDSVDPNNHEVDWVGSAISTPATCLRDGVELDWCDYCNVYASRPIPATGHSYTDKYEDKAPTCTEDGYYILTCSVCFKDDITATLKIKAHEITKDNEAIAKFYDEIKALYDEDKHVATGHSYLKADGSYYDTFFAKWPTCEQDGQIYKLCSGCDARELLTLDECAALGYDMAKYNHYNPLKNESSIKHKIDLPVCGVDGAEYDICGLCGTKWNETVIKYEMYNKDHHAAAGINPDSKYPNGVYREATCEITALYDYKCTACGLQFFYEDTAAGHKYSDLVKGSAPTCTEDGVLDHYTCENCPKLFVKNDKGEFVLIDSKVDPAKGHNYGEFIKETPATCEGEGELGHYTCSVCNKNFDAEKKEITGSLVIKAAGHAYGDLIAEDAAECEATGLKAHHHCSVCGKYFDADKNEVKYDDLVLSALNHAYVVVETVAATCTAPGYVRHSCARCGNIDLKVIDVDVDYIDGYVLPNGHTPVAVDDIAPTCTVAGKKGVVKCSVCGTILNEGEVVDAGHYNKDGYKIEEKCGDKVTDRVCVNAGCPFNGEAIPAHEFKVTHYDANCVQYEYELKVCAKCGHWEHDIIREQFGDHKASSIVVDTEKSYAATCKADGLEVKKCADCGVQVSETVLPKVSHEFGAWTIVNEAELGVAGSKTRACKYNCGETETEAIPALEGVQFSYEFYNALDKDADFVNSGKVAFKVYMNAYNASLYNIYLAFDYDVDVLTYAGGQMIFDAFENDRYEINGANGVAVINYSVNADSVLVDETVSTEGKVEFAIIEFTINSGMDVAGAHDDVIALGSSKFTSSVTNAAGDKVADVEFGSADVDVEVKLLCDASKDGVFNGQDAVICLDFVKANGSKYSAEADINKDGKIDLSDYMAIMRWINQKESYEDICG